MLERMTRVPAVLFALGISATSGAAQTASTLSECHAFSEGAARLECYDSETGYTIPTSEPEQNADEAPVATTLEEARETELVRQFVVAVGALNFDRAKELLEPSVASSLSEEARSAMEEALLAEVRPLPASQIQQNLDGYALLAILRPDQETYAAKVEQYEGALVAQRSEALRRLESERDEFRGVTFYRHSDEPRYIDIRSRISLYIADPDAGQPFLRVETVYTEDSWLFVEDVQVSIDGQISQFTSGEFLRDNDSEIWEWRDEVPSSYQLSLLRQMAEAGNVIMRFNGQQYYDDKTLTDADKRMIRDVLSAYDQMSES